MHNPRQPTGLHGPGLARTVVAYVVESLGPGGAERQVVELLRNLDRTRFSPRVLAYYPNNYYRGDLDQLEVPVHFVRRASRFDPRVVLRIARWLWSGQVSIVDSLLETPGLYAIMARELARRGRIAVRESSCHLTGSRLFWARKSWVHRHADITIANSIAGARVVRERVGLPAERVRFVPNMIDGEKFCQPTPAERAALRKALGWRDDHRVVLTVGTFSPYKNHIGIAAALEDLPVSSSLRFCWVGAESDGALGKAVRKRLAVSGLEGRIQIHPLQPRIEDFYKACDVFLLNSVQEGTPNVILEALACGRPIIATDVSDVSRYVLRGKTGWLVPVNAPTALRRAMRDVEEATPERLTSMGQAAGRLFSSLGCGPTEVTATYTAIYDELLAM